MVIEESNLALKFSDDCQVVKFDDTDFYRSRFNKLPGAKGVDIISNSAEVIQFIEIKNCTGHESENIWRTSVNNSKIESAPRELDVDNRDSLDIEVAKKVEATIACLCGAWTESRRTEKAKMLENFWRGLTDSGIPRDKKKIIVVLFLEGDFCANGPQSRTKKMMMDRIRMSISAKLEWLNCKVLVVDSDTYNKTLFELQ